MDMPPRPEIPCSLASHWLGALFAADRTSQVLAISIRGASLAWAAQALAAPVTIDSFFVGQNAPLAAPPGEAPDLALIARGRWQPENAAGDRRYGCALVDASHVTGDLGRLFETVAAVLEPNAVFACLVPFGYKRDGSFPYVLSDSLIARLLCGHGLAVVSATWLPDPAHGGPACFYICRHDPGLKAGHFDESRLLLKRFNFIPHSDPSFTYAGTWNLGGKGERIARGATAVFTWQGEAEELLVVCERHPWSGIGEFHVRGRRATVNLLSWFAHTHAEQVFTSHLGAMPVKLTGRSLGADRHALGSELVIHGMLRR